MEQFVSFCIQIKGSHFECYINAINAMVIGKNNLNEQVKLSVQSVIR